MVKQMSRGLYIVLHSFLFVKFATSSPIMGNSRKYPYSTTDGFLEFRRQGGYLRLEFRRYRGVSDLGFPEGTDK